jgi:Heterokaryon incompatibility protein (HET)
MRLLNVITLELELFPDPVPENVPYAILSHTWTHDEVTFDDMRDVAFATTRSGFAKILAACEKAQHHGLAYIWVDTCCIDKSSSAELSEGINSMFRWYKNSTVCFAFLSDLPTGTQNAELSILRKCRWWTRGWTLQELIAPTNLIFVDEGWNVVGTKLDLADAIEAITGISRWVLNGQIPLSSIPLAKRMSWAAARETTRVEDKAYCLLGIFDVNIPMIYGEGSKAFIRLQEEILSKTTDLSIFAWKASNNSKTHRGILAETPAEFLHCGFVELSDDQFRFRDEISLTNRGVKIRTPIKFQGNGIYIMDLHCYDENLSFGTSKRLGIYLQRALDTYYRSSPHENAQAEIVSSARVPRSIFLASTADEESAASLATERNCRKIFFQFPTTKQEYRLHDIKAVPETYWDAHEQYFSIGALPSFKCFVRFSITSRVSRHYGTTTEETRSFIAVCDLTTGPDFRISLYAQSGLQSSSKPNEFIDPFIDIDQYGPLGDAFSLSVLRPGEREDRKVSMIHKDHHHNYTVSASLSTVLSPSFLVIIEVIPPDAGENAGRGPMIQGYGTYGVPQAPKREHPNDREREAWSGA